MRLPELSIHHAPWYLRPFFWNQRRKYGQVLRAALVWARAPKLFLAVAALYGVLDRRGSPMPPVLRSLVTVRISQINHCAFCQDLNSEMLVRRTGSTRKLVELVRWRDRSLFNAQQRAALEYAEAVTYPDRAVADELFAELLRHFDEEAIVELTGLIAFQNLSSKFNSALDVTAQGFCHIPQITDIVAARDGRPSS